MLKNLGLSFASFILGIHVASANVVFEKKQIEIAGRRIEVEIADTEEKRTQGLMFRTSLPDDKGMLFIFDQPQVLAFWMKDTRIPLSIAFFDRDKKLINIHEMTVAKSRMPDHLLPRYVSQSPALYALEMPSGWFAKKKVALTSNFSFISSESRARP